MAKKKRRSPLQVAYSRLQKGKSAFCAGKKTKTEVKKLAKTYVDRAVKAGQTKTEAQKKANRILNAGCKMTARVAGTKRKKRKTTKRRRRSA